MPGEIHAETKSFFHLHAAEKNLIKPFLDAGFDVTWANTRTYERTVISVMFLRASPALAEAYGFEYELILAYSKYESLETRTIRAIEHVFTSDPAKGRVEPLLCFLISEATDAESWVTSYLLENKESRIVIPFPASVLSDPSANSWTVRNQFQKYFLSVDRYKYTLPLREDSYFFGRSGEIGQLLDFTKRNENAAVFGLRKTGKTSLLMKFKRTVERDKRHMVEIFDAQRPSFRKRSWNQALKYISDRLLKRAEIEHDLPYSELDAAENFSEVVSLLFSSGKCSRLTIIIDEIEWMTPGTAANKHWDSDFLEFWQVIRTTQVDLQHLNVILAGVNPAIAEESRFGDYQNPLFGIVTPIFLRGLIRAESDDLVQKIGKIVGLSFEQSALDSLYSQYAGHPLLTRLACSHVAQMGKANGDAIPMRITKNRLDREQSLRDGELVFYVRHVVDELERFYPIEYGYLEALAVGDYQGFRAAASQSQACAHLFRYGVVSAPEHPYMTYSVVGDYVAKENARREGRPWVTKLVPVNDRKAFVEVRIKEIAEDMRELERAAKIASLPSLFGPNSFPEADRLRDIATPADAQSLGSALSTLNRCFVESIDRYGSSIGNSKYFWTEVKNNYPAVYDALRRIRVYRNNEHHLELLPTVEATLREFLTRDLDDALASSSEKFWALFQRCLDELILAIQRELSRLAV